MASTIPQGYAGASGTPAGGDSSGQPPLPGATPSAASGAGATPAAGAAADPNDPAAQYEAYRAYWYVPLISKVTKYAESNFPLGLHTDMMSTILHSKLGRLLKQLAEQLGEMPLHPRSHLPRRLHDKNILECAICTRVNLCSKRVAWSLLVNTGRAAIEHNVVINRKHR